MKRLLPLLLLLLLSACYRPSDGVRSNLHFTDRQIDSLSFQSHHHYTNNYNFVVEADSLCLLLQQPEEFLGNMFTDTFAVFRDERLVVAEIRILADDPMDSVWVKLGTEQSTFGWVHESELLAAVSPDDPISQFISIFSDVHLLVFLVIICLISCAYLVRKQFNKNAPVVHFRDIPSIYPTLLAVVVATAATFYASMQMYVPNLWQHFYFNPTMNPWAVPWPLSMFLVLVWSILIIALAAVDDVCRRLPLGEACLYLSGLAAVCAVDYILFSILTLYYIGYALLMAYAVFSFIKLRKTLCR